MTLPCISSMATLLNALAATYQTEMSLRIAIESVGGVEAAKRVQNGELFDVVILASAATERLADAGIIERGQA